jgi:hypothetical protein
MASVFPTSKDQKVFFINNFDSIISIFQEKQILSDELQKFEELLMHQRELFAEEEIKAFFPRLVNFVLQVLLVCSFFDGSYFIFLLSLMSVDSFFVYLSL